MTITQIPLTDAEDRALDEIAAQTGKTRDELLREAVDQFLVRHRPPEWLQRLRQGRGLWKDRDDLPSLEALRGEMDRF
jgi:predicted transcriptional regulator